MGWYERFGKRLLDVIGAASSIVILSPLFVAVALAVRLQDAGPAVFRQARVGRFSKPFTLYKFRSMPVSTPNLPSASGRQLDVTTVGRFIRRTNLDELPQLFNVLRGEMSLIGPRPALASQSQLLALRLQHDVMRVRPGLTGLAQVNAYDGMSEVEKVDWERRYVERITFFGDVTIVARTFAYVLRPPPVY